MRTEGQFKLVTDTIRIHDEAMERHEELRDAAMRVFSDEVWEYLFEYEPRRFIKPTKYPHWSWMFKGVHLGVAHFEHRDNYGDHDYDARVPMKFFTDPQGFREEHDGAALTAKKAREAAEEAANLKKLAELTAWAEERKLKA